jgi:selenide,water dikinase
MNGNGFRELVLIGGGHAHVQVLEAFAKEPPPDCRMTVVVDTPVAMYSGMVPGFVAGDYRQEELEIDVRPLAALAGANVVVAAATMIDADERRIELIDHDPVSYDLASVNIGSTVLGLDLPGVREHALPTRPIGRFVQRVGELLEHEQDHQRSDPFRVVVVGAGAGGVEVALTVQHRLRQDTNAPLQITLLDAGPRVLSGYRGSLVRRVERLCVARDIAIRCNQRVAAVEGDAIVLTSGERVGCDLPIWVTGPASHPLFGASGLSTDQRGFGRVRSTLQLEDHDELLAVGDCASLIEFPGTPKAGVYAVREGPYVTQNLRALLAGEPLQAYRPQGDFLTLLNAGGGLALGTKWGISFQGRWVMRWKDRIDRAFMRRFQVSEDV